MPSDTPATTELWCVHIIGPDDVIAYPDRAAAEREVAIINTALQRRLCGREADENWPTLYATVAPWPHDAQSHAADLARNIEQMECSGNG